MPTVTYKSNEILHCVQDDCVLYGTIEALSHTTPTVPFLYVYFVSNSRKSRNLNLPVDKLNFPDYNTK